MGTAPRVYVGPVARSKFQLLGSAALLVASKLREAVPLGVRRLVQFTDHSITDAELAVCHNYTTTTTVLLDLGFDLRVEEVEGT